MSTTPPTFAELGLRPALLSAIEKLGYTQPSPIQALTIPALLAGRDVLGQAQTGTGKTAAFALPLLNNVELDKKRPQVLVLAPTRELAQQVAEAFTQYGRGMGQLKVAAVYGGQPHRPQIQTLKRGPQVVVGTPGRVIDFIKSGTLSTDALAHLVLDEADEMLRMGFIDDVQWILEQCPQKRQTALLSATMPPEIAKIASRHLQHPEHIRIERQSTTAETVEQRYWQVDGLHKLDALTRIFEVEAYETVIVFVRTKQTTLDLAERLRGRGFQAAALNGDMPQAQREQTVTQLKRGEVNFLIATDVAARGLDLPRISHVVNYDMPFDAEAYVHRIGRTGRAGQTGKAILFVARRERNLLRMIERRTGAHIDPMQLPSAKDVQRRRVEKLAEALLKTVEHGELDDWHTLAQTLGEATGLDAETLTAATLAQIPGLRPSCREVERRPERAAKSKPAKRVKNKKKRADNADVRWELFRIEVGHRDRATPKHIVGAIANEADIDSAHIGQIRIQDDHSTVELPTGMPKAVYQTLQKTRVCQKPLHLSRMHK